MVMRLVATIAKCSYCGHYTSIVCWKIGSEGLVTYCIKCIRHAEEGW